MCAALLVAGCSDDGGSGDASETGDTGDTGGEEMIELEVEEGCNPLVGASCALPYPNMTQVEEADTPTGYQLAFTPDTLGFAGPDRGDRPALADYLNRADGFSVGTGIVAQLGDQAPDWTLLPAWNSVESSLQPDSAVQIFDLDTGERVPCWGEVDLRTSDVERRAIMVRQAQALEPGHRHLVVITDTLKAEDGADMEPWPAFRALRDEVPTNADVVVFWHGYGLAFTLDGGRTFHGAGRKLACSRLGPYIRPDLFIADGELIFAASEPDLSQFLPDRSPPTPQWYRLALEPGAEPIAIELRRTSEGWRVVGLGL